MEAAKREKGRSQWSQWNPVAVMVLVVVLGCADGGMRAYFQLPTIFGEEMSYVRDQHLNDNWNYGPERIEAVAPSHGTGRTLLAQAEVGQPCKMEWNCKPGFVCVEGLCAACDDDKECQMRNPKNQCQNQTDGVPLCKHKPLFHPFDTSDTYITIITLCTIILAAPAGVGGGGILVPMYLAIGRFSPHYGIPLSKATIFGGAVTNNYFNVQRRHPVANRPLIDYNACLMLEPVLLLGTIIGVFFNAVSPGWLITGLLVLSLTWTTYRTYLKATDTYQKEEMSEKEAETQRLLPAGNKGPTQLHQSFQDPDTLPPELRSILESESKVNWYSIGVLCVSWITIAFFSILKGGEGGGGIVPCGTAAYWGLVVAPVPVVFGLVWYCGNQLADEHDLKVKCGYEFCDGDLQWTRRNVRMYPSVCITAGFAAGALGIAAGTILGPVLLEFGMLPIVGTSSSGFMVIFTASSTTFQFLVMGQLQVDYAMFFCFVGLFGGAIGNTGVNYLVKKYKKTWFVVAILTAVLGASTFLMGIAGYMRGKQTYDHGGNMGLRPLCPLVLNPNLLHHSGNPHMSAKPNGLAQTAKKSPLIHPSTHK